MTICSKICTFAVFTSHLWAQTTLSVSADQNLVDIGTEVTVTISLAGSGISGVQWELADGAWTTSLSDKQIHCEGVRCILVGLDNATEIPSRVIATSRFTILADRTFELTGVLGVAPDGTTRAVGAGAQVLVAVFRPFDLNRDGSVDLADVNLGIDQALGRAACSDLDGDGKCTVVGVQRVVNGRS